VRASRFLLPILLLLPLSGAAQAKVEHPSIGVCTRKEEFQRRQEDLDGEVLALQAEAKEAKRKALVKKLVKRAEEDIECLIRYREPHLVPVLLGVVSSSKRWYTRSRALYALKMVGGRGLAGELGGALADKHSMVREAAALTLGHWGGEEAAALLEARAAKEDDPYARAAMESALVLARATARPYDGYPGDKRWSEELVGAEGARRVAWAWTVKGEKLFNDYEAATLAYPAADRFVYPIQRYEEDLFAGYPRNSFGAGGTHAGEDCAWFRDGSAVYAVADGVVRMVQGAGGDWGFLVAVEHRLEGGRYVVSVYGHLGFDLRVKAGDLVKAGQCIGTVGLSCSTENGGYGAHLHFGLGDGPFRRPARLAVGDKVGFDAGDGTKVPAPVLRMGYSENGRTERGWPLTTFTLQRPDGKEQVVEVPEQELGQEVGWFQAYVKDCRGWLDPQSLLPVWVKGERPGR
jgi:murein DD-endopeptidase MepM/ murein hydrolase activator NlpD